LICPNPKCNNISSKLYIVENKIIEFLKIWLKNYKVNYESLKDKSKTDSNKMIEQYIICVKKELEKENVKLNKIYEFLENGIYSKEDFINRYKIIKENIQNLEEKLKEYNEIRNRNVQIKKEEDIYKLENIIDVYNNLENAEHKNVLLKSVISKVYYLKTEKIIEKNLTPTNFELHIYPKLPKG